MPREMLPSIVNHPPPTRRFVCIGQSKAINHRPYSVMQ